MIGLSGCGSGDKPQTDNDRNLQALTVFYGKYAHEHRGMGPSGEAEFRQFVKGRPAAELSQFGLTAENIDTIFSSPRDRQAYGVAWKVRSGVPGPDGSGMVIWEQLGVSGKHMVADGLGKIEEIDQATFEKRLGMIPKS